MKKKIGILFFSTALSLLSQEKTAVPVFDTISGRLPSVLQGEGRRYVVTSDIMVPPGETVIISKGAVLLFRNFTGIQVLGTLLAKGTRDSPVIFTSEYDSTAVTSPQKTAAPYDWNGITVTESGIGSIFRNCAIRYSLFGINALTEFITVDSCTFTQNGKSDLKIMGVQRTGAGGIISYVNSRNKNVRKVLLDGPSESKKYVGAGMILLTAAGLAASAYEGLKYRSAQSHLDRISDTRDPANLENPTIVQDWDTARKTRDYYRALFYVSIGGTIIGAAGFVISINL